MSKMTMRRLLTGAVATLALAGGIAGSVAAPAQAASRVEKVGTAQVGFMVSSNMNNRCLDIRSSNPYEGASVGMWDCEGGTNQRWYWDGSQLRSDLSNLCLDIVGANNRDGGAVQMYTCYGWPSQQWRWDGARLRNPSSGKCLDISNSNTYVGASVQIWTCKSVSNQNWHTT